MTAGTDAMRKLVLWMSISLDGFFEGPNHELDWHLVDDELHSHFNEALRTMGAFLNGRVTYELMAGFWPTADGDPSMPGPMREFAAIWRDMPKIVYSRTLDHADWTTTIVREVVPEEVRALKAEPGGDLVLGGANLAATFVRLDLIDEYRLYVHAVVLGRGRPLFPPSNAPLNLRFRQTRTFGNGSCSCATSARLRRDLPLRLHGPDDLRASGRRVRRQLEPVEVGRLV